MDDENVGSEKPHNKRRWFRWLLWWEIEPEELKKQAEQYSTLKFYQSARGISALLLSLSGGHLRKRKLLHAKGLRTPAAV
jgi:hypothetical protein